jgi:hypothetical protein
MHKVARRWGQLGTLTQQAGSWRSGLDVMREEADPLGQHAVSYENMGKKWVESLLRNTELATPLLTALVIGT